MEFNLKQWRDHDSDIQQQQSPKIPRHHHQQQQQVAAALPLFLSSDTPPTAIPTSTPFSSRMGGRSYFSLVQWQELELQALIYRHMVAGSSIPPELLQLVKKSIFSSSTSPYYLQHYSPYFQPPIAAALLQAGYWGKGSMDPEPGRCRRTDGKKWRCSRDVVAGHKYCERHMHRGRNRSRKPVEFPAAASTSAASTSAASDALVGSLHKPSTTTFAYGSIGADTQFSLSSSGVSSPLDAFQLDFGGYNKKTHFGPQLESSSTSRDDGKSNKVLMRFFDDYPRSDDGDGNSLASSTSLSMSTPRNSSSDFLRLSTGNGDEVGPRSGNENENEENERGQQLNWGGAGGWGANPVNSMGGPLAEVLRSSSNSSPTSVLHQLPRSSAPDTSIVSS